MAGTTNNPLREVATVDVKMLLYALRSGVGDALFITTIKNIYLLPA